jgi:hypothetical protein
MKLYHRLPNQEVLRLVFFCKSEVALWSLDVVPWERQPVLCVTLAGFHHLHVVRRDEEWLTFSPNGFTQNPPSSFSKNPRLHYLSGWSTQGCNTTTHSPVL